MGASRIGLNASYMACVLVLMFATAEFFFHKHVIAKRRSECRKCPTQSSPTNQVQAVMGQMFRRESGALVCAPAARTCLSVSIEQDGENDDFFHASISTNPYLSHAGALGFFCPAILSCYTANKYGENCCLGCLPGGMTAIRTHMRLTYGIQVSY